jgi:phage terminase large subunit-like protein
MIVTAPALEPEGRRFPSLGAQVASWMEANLTFGPGDLRGDPYVLDPEKRALLHRVYEVHPRGTAQEGRRRFSRSALSLQKGSAKTEFGAAIAAAELAEDGPVRFGGWDAAGSPVGIGLRDPYIPLLAATEEQSDELCFTALYVMLSEGPLADLFDIGLTRIRRADGSGRAVALAGAPNARDGARTTFQVADEAHGLDLPRLVGAWDTMVANAAKRMLANAWSLELGTAFVPGEGSVAERTWHYAQSVIKGEHIDPGLYYFHRGASPDADLSTPEGVRAAVLEAAGPTAAWKDVDAIAKQFDDPTADKAHLARVWLNVHHQATSQAFDILKFESLVRPNYLPADGSRIVLGFDGAFINDATALVGVELATNHLFVLGIWAKPDRTRATWSVDRDDVDAAVREAFRRWDVWLGYFDPHYWESHIADWKATFRQGKRDRVEEFDTRGKRNFSYGLRNLATAIDAGELTHDGNPTLISHFGNARRVDSRLAVGADGQPLWTIQKERPDSPKKIDLAVASTLAWEARNAAISANANAVSTMPEKPRVRKPVRVRLPV